MKSFKVIILIQLLLAICATLLHSQDTYALKVSPVNEFLRGANIACIDQSADGFIWLGTSDGLYRFDGYDCLPIWELIDVDSSMLRSPVVAIHASDPASIYVSTESGSIYALDSKAFSFNKIAVSGTAPSTGLERFLDFGISRDGSLFARQRGGELFFKVADRDAFVPIGLKNYPSASSHDGASYSIDPGDGSLWLRLSEHEYLHINREDGALIAVDDAGEVPYENVSWGDSWCLHGSADVFWVAVWGVGLFSYSHAAGMAPVLADGLYPLAAATDPEGRLVVLQSDLNIVRLNPETMESVTLYEATGSEPAAINGVFIDGNGLLWITNGHGIFNLIREETSISFFEIPVSAANVTVNDIDVYDASNLLIASEAGLYRMGMDGGYHPLTSGSQYLAGSRVEDGTIFASSASGGFLRINSAGAVDVVGDYLQVRDIAVDSVGVVWMAAIAEGIGEYQRESKNLHFWNVELPREDYLRSLDAVTIHKAGDDAIWAGTSDLGLLRILPDRQHYTRITEEQGLLSDRIHHISESPSGMLWISSAFGLTRFDPETDEIENFTTVEHLPAVGILAAIEDDNGFVWFSSSAGVHRYSPQDKVAVKMIEASDSVSNMFTAGAAFKDAYGSIYFGSARGVHKIRIQGGSAGREKSGADFVVSAIQTSDTGTVPVNSVMEEGELRIGYGNNSFRIEIALLDYAEPEKNVYRYYLEGVDHEPVIGTGKGVAEYARVPPGEYAFVYAAADRSGEWIPEKSLRIVVVPPFWMTLEFQLLVVLAVILAFFGIYKIRTGAIRQQRNALQKEVNERRIAQGQLLSYQQRLRQLAARLTIAEEVQRRRIAGILHDHIGQALMMSKAKLDKYNLDNKKETDAELKKVGELVQQAIKETRSLTVEVSPPSLQKFGLEAALESLVDKMSDDHGIEIIMERSQDTRLSDDISVLIYQSARELLFNVIKHANASRVRVYVGNSGDEFVLSVSDNGVGFDLDKALAKADEEMGYGLFSIRERMESIGGTMRLHSKIGTGASIELVVPLKK